MASDAFEPEPRLMVGDLETLKVLADERRTRLIDLLRSRSATVKELAETLGVGPKSLYYHVNLLEKHGLIRVVETHLVSGIVEKRYRATAYLFDFGDLPFGIAAGRERRALESVSSFFTITLDELRAAVESGRIDLADEAANEGDAAFRWSLLRLSPERGAELGRRVGALFEEFEAQGAAAADVEFYRCLVTIFPTIASPNRTPPSEEEK